MIRALHVIPAIAPRYGGPSTVIVEVCQALVRNGVSIQVVSTDTNGNLAPITRNDIKSELNIKLFRKTFSESFQYAAGFKVWLQNSLDQFDLVHGHAMWAYLTGAAAQVCFQNHKPFILRPAGMLSSYSLEKKSILKKIFWHFREKHMVRNATAFHATSQGEAEEIRRLRPDADIWTIPHGLPDEAFSVPAEPDWLRQRCPGAGDKPIILFFSRIHPKKGLSDILIPAFSQMTPGFHLAIAGGEDSHVAGYENEVRQKVQALGLKDRVTFLGSINPEDRWRLLDGAAVFVLPSQSENFGVVVTEAMARGTPVVISDQVQIGDIVEKNSGGRVIPRDATLWAQTLSEVVQNPWNRYPRFRGTWDTAAKAVIQGYEKILKAK